MTLLTLGTTVLEHNREAYQEGRETDCTILCVDGLLMVSELQFGDYNTNCVSEESVTYLITLFEIKKFSKNLMILLNLFPTLICISY